MDLGLLISATFCFCIVLYAWLAVRIKSHAIVEKAYESFKDQYDPLKDEGSEDMSAPPPDVMSSVATSSSYISVRVLMLGLTVYVGVIVVDFVVKYLLQTDPKRIELEINGKEYIAINKEIGLKLDETDRKEYIKELENRTKLPKDVISSFTIHAMLLLSLCIVTFLLTHIYSKLCIKIEDTYSVDSMHMHVDAIMFILLMIYSMMIVFCVYLNRR
jgi:hypothetical protein